MSPPHLGVFGAGSIGAYLGTRLALGGADVSMLARQSLVSARAELSAADLGHSLQKAPDSLQLSTDPQVLSDIDICLLTVKMGALAESVEVLNQVLPEDCLVVALQNGLGSTEILQQAGLKHRVLEGMVTFNVVWKDGAQFHKATSGPVMVQTPTRAEHREALVASFGAAEEDLRLTEQIAGVKAGKLLFNLGNGLCAAAGAPTAEFVAQREGREVFSMVMKEGISVLKQAKHPIKNIGILSAPLVSRLLRLPDGIFKQVARSMLTIDPQARSSTLVDLDRGKKTEIDFLNGAIAQLGQKHGVATPFNSWVVKHIHELEEGQAQFLPFDQILGEFQRISS